MFGIAQKTLVRFDVHNKYSFQKVILIELFLTIYIQNGTYGDNGKLLCFIFL